MVLLGGKLVIELEKIPENLTINVWLDNYRDGKVELRLYERWHLENRTVQRGAYIVYLISRTRKDLKRENYGEEKIFLFINQRKHPSYPSALR